MYSSSSLQDSWFDTKHGFYRISSLYKLYKCINKPPTPRSLLVHDLEAIKLVSHQLTPNSVFSKLVFYGESTLCKVDVLVSITTITLSTKFRRNKDSFTTFTLNMDYSELVVCGGEIKLLQVYGSAPRSKYTV